jgi:hypothetical protein
MRFSTKDEDELGGGQHTIEFADMADKDDEDVLYQVTTDPNEDGVRIESRIDCALLYYVDIDNCIAALRRAQALRKLCQVK